MVRVMEFPWVVYVAIGFTQIEEDLQYLSRFEKSKCKFDIGSKLSPLL